MNNKIIIYIFIGIVLFLSGCINSYESCISDCEQIHNDDIDAVRYRCIQEGIDSIGVENIGWRYKVDCYNEAQTYVWARCYDECRGVQ